MGDGGGRAAVEHHRPGVDDEDPVEVQREVKVVGGEDDLLAEPGQGPPQQFPVAQVQQGGGLVQDQHLRVHGEDGGEGQELPLPAGELVDALVGQRQQPETVQGRLRLAAAFPRVADRTPEGELNILPARRHHQLGQRIGEDEADAPAYLPHRADRVRAVHRDGAAARRHESVQEPQQGGLAGTVGADHADPLLREPQAQLLKQGLGRGAAVDGHPHRSPVQHDGAHGRLSASAPTAGAADTGPGVAAVRIRRISRSGKALCRASATVTASAFLITSPG